MVSQRLLLSGVLLALGLCSSARLNKNEVRARQREAAQKFHGRTVGVGAKNNCVQNITFSNPKASGK
jgi:hypothetical protein